MKHASFFSFFIPSALLVLSLLFSGAVNPTSMRFVYEGILELPYQETASSVAMPAIYQEKARFISEVYDTKDPFQLLSLEWEQALPATTQASLEVRVLLQKEATWSDWRPAVQGEDTPSFVKSTQNSFYFLTPDALAFQYRFDMSTDDVKLSPRLKNVRFEAINGGELSLGRRLARLVFDTSQEYQTRKDWGANEELRMTREDPNADEASESGAALYPDQELARVVKTDEMGSFYKWPLEYPKNGVQKIIIHHTASEDINEESDFSKTVRAIYQYHTVTKGWGDIGYNFLVAPDGRVYEGRAGGDAVVAGHASGFNVGSLGIALVGNYEDDALPAAMFQSLSRLVLDKAKQHKLDLAGSNEFRGKARPNLLGHRDVSATLCPGGYAYDVLPDLRLMISQVVKEDAQKIKKTGFDFADEKDREMLILQAGESKKISLSLKNTGEVAWTKGACFQLETKKDKGISFEGQCHLTLKESSVKAGATGTFEGTVKAAYQSGLALYQGSLVQGKNFSSNKASVAFYVEKAELLFQINKQSKAYTFKAGESKEIALEIKNTSNFDWTKEEAFFLKASQATQKWAADVSLKDGLKKGEKMILNIKLKAPEKLGGSVLQWTLQNKAGSLLAEKKLSLVVKVLGDEASETKQEPIVFQSQEEAVFAPNEKRKIWIQLKNTSGESIKKLDWAIQAPSGFKVDKPSMVLKNWPHNMSVKWSMMVQAPQKEGLYRIEIRPRSNNQNLSTEPYIIKVEVKKNSKSSESVDSSEGPSTSLDKEIPIRLTFDEVLTSTELLADTSVRLESASLKKTLELKKGEKVRVSLGDGLLHLVHNRTLYSLKEPLHWIPNEASTLTSLVDGQRRPAWNLKLNDNQFYGKLSFYTQKDELLVVNTLGVEKYLTGLGEISNHTEPEKMKTMVILARSYALYYVHNPSEKFPNQPYVLDDTPERSQKYLGASLSLRAPKIKEAVAMTKNLVITYDGNLVKTPYFTQTDGTKTRSAKEVWGWTHTPYLLSVPDSYCKGTDKFLGHGVGLSGCGADAMAKEGFKFKEIIKYFYTGVEVSDYTTLTF